MKGEIGVLNVGAGDTKLTFDNKNPAECVRTGRMVEDMIKRGYVLMVEDPPGSGTYTRATSFNPETSEYLIADFDSAAAYRHDQTEKTSGDDAAAATSPSPAADEGPAAKPQPKRGRTKLKSVHASTTRSVAVPRSAGG